MHAEETVDYHLRYVWASISRMYNAEASKYKGTMSIGYVLLNIDKEGTPSTSLGPKMGMESTSLSRTLKRMEDQGLIIRKKDKKDGRMVRIFLSDLGMAMREKSRQSVLQLNHVIREQIEPEKLDVFFEVMKKMQFILNQEDVFQNISNQEQ
ncbi:MAG: MarR family transcriptional regulator [Flavobacteriales bacterium]|nr:MarR family transcriptional regulator [Flavobacteriales bacterium]